MGKSIPSHPMKKSGRTSPQRHWCRQLWGTGARTSAWLPSSNNLFFSVNFRAAQSLTATLCGCLSKHLYSATAAAVVESRLYEPCSVYYLASFYVRRKVLCPLGPDPGSHCPAAAVNGLGAFRRWNMASAASIQLLYGEVKTVIEMSCSHVDTTCRQRHFVFSVFVEYSFWGKFPLKLTGIDSGLEEADKASFGDCCSLVYTERSCFG